MSVTSQTVESLQLERAKLKDEISKKMELSRTVPGSELGKLALEIAQLEAQENLIVSNIHVLEAIERKRKEAEEIEVKRKARARKEALRGRWSKHPLICDQGHRTEFIGFRSLRGLSIENCSWLESPLPDDAYNLRFDCPKCRCMFLRTPAELAKMEQEQEKSK
jgi:hypothetical protein